MLFSYYKETPLEQWINTKFLARGIMTTINHDIERIAEAFEVALVYDICPSFSDNEDGVIFLNKHADDVTARVIFFMNCVMCSGMQGISEICLFSLKALRRLRRISLSYMRLSPFIWLLN